MRLITLLTDFGLKDWFVGTMKGVILSINESARVFDITHEVPPGDIFSGAFALAASYRFFPRHTIHVAVVDPGVGSQRAPLAIETDSFIFLGPDNGLMSLAASQEAVLSVRRLENNKIFRESISETFHGRDIFAPVAAHLSRGMPLDEVGPVIDIFHRLSFPVPDVEPNQIAGQVIYVDRFGNAITNIRGDQLGKMAQERRQVRFGDGIVVPLAGFYAAVARGAGVAVIGSAGYLEIAIHGGNAAETFQLKAGDLIIVTGLAKQ